MDAFFGIGAVMIVGFFVVASFLGVLAFARTSALQREIAVLKLIIPRRERSATAPSEEERPVESPEPMAYSYGAAANESDAQSGEPEPSTPSRAERPLPEPAPRAAVSLTEASSATPDKPITHVDLEDIIGGKWFNAIGLLAILLATAFFLKYAFDSNWIGPIGRVALGVVAGSAVLVVSEWIFRRGWIYFAEGLTALGAGILYLSLYAAWNFYHLIAPEAAFAGLAVVTGLLIAIALRRDSQRLAALALLGGYAAPLLVSTGHDAQVPLFSYLALLNAGLLWMAVKRDWRSLSASFLFTLLYGAVWYTHFYDPSKLGASLIFATIFFLQFACLPAILARRDGALRPDGVALTLLNAAWYLFALDTMLYGSHRWLLTAAVLATGLFFIALTTLVPKLSGKGHAQARPIFGSIAFALVTVAVPIRLQGQWIDMAWAVEGALLVWTGLRSDTPWLRWNGVAVLIIVAVYLFASPLSADRAFVNGRFATFVVVVGAFAVVRWLTQRYESVIDQGEEAGYRAIGIAANAFAIYELSAETLRALRPAGDTFATSLPLQIFGVTLLWVVYALALAAFAYARDSAVVRWQAWFLFAIVLCKAPLADFFTGTNGTAGVPAIRALTFVVAVAAMALALSLSRRHATVASAAERSIFDWFEVAINVYAVWALTVVVSQLFGQPSIGRVELSLQMPQQALAVTGAWALYALGLAVYAKARVSHIACWQALCLFAFVLLMAPGTDFSTNLAPHDSLSFPRVLVFAGIFCTLLVTLVVLRRTGLGETERTVLRILEVGLNVFGVWALSVVIWQAFAGPPASAAVSWSAAQQLGISLAWTIYAVVLIGIGVWRESSLIRWQALALFAMVILKAFLFDLSLLTLGYRIASFMVLGLMLLGASFLYQRRLFRRQPQEPPQ